MGDLTLNQAAKLVVERLTRNYKNVDWGKEMVVAKRLMRKFPEIELWGVYIPENKRPNSLLGYYSPNFREVLDDHIANPVENPNPQRYTLSPNKVGKDLNIKKDKTVLEFIYGEN